MSIKEIQESYDKTPYRSSAYGTTLPQRQKSMLQIFGFKAPNLEKARVLEIGCSFGGNIMTHALAYPNSECVGIDLSETQIEKGKEVIEKLGIKNLSLYAKDICEYNNEFGQFDYIICHGVFSWVPENVRERILEVIKSSLAKNGSAIVSYNTYPGWKIKDVIRDIMLFRVDELNRLGADVNESNIVESANGAVRFFNQNTPFEYYKNTANEVLDKHSAHYIRHEYLEHNNVPLYLYHFNHMANKYGLSHICDAELSKTIPPMNEEIEEVIDGQYARDSVTREQYYDFIYNRVFRISILTHSENKEKLNISRNIRFVDMDKLHLRAKFSRNEQGDIELASEYHHELLDFIDQAYPNTVKISDIVSKLTKNSEITAPSLYNQISNLIYSNKVENFADSIKVKNKKKPKLKSGYRDYYAYVLENKDPVVVCGDFSGKLLDVNQVTVIVALFFDGTRTEQDVVDRVLEEINKENGLLRAEGDAPPNIQALVAEIRKYLESSLLFE